ncbi:hypothetical protein B0J17DRAFT_719313 [Rhizoctonia solani]|nr:hypothetical protein B0J17DRAFT_719313 [Rhizoctonia solani]
MTTSRPEPTSHETFRPLSQDFFNSYPPYVLVNSQEDAKSVLSAGCEAGYLLVLDADSPPGVKSFKSDEINEFRGRIGIIIYALPSNEYLSIVASRLLELLAIDGTAIGFANPEQSIQWKEACFEWAKAQKTVDAQGQKQDGLTLEWSAKDVKGKEWVEWTVVKKAPEWAFC